MIIGGKRIAADAPVFIVAELSANHGASLDLALRSIDAAASAGASAIKIQTYTPDTLTLPLAVDPFIVRTDNVWNGRTLHDLYAEGMTPWEWTDALAARAREHGLGFFSTPFDTSAVDFLVAHGADAMKVASFELADLPLVEYVARTGLPLILSTGMAALAEIDRALAACRAAGNNDIALLRCVSTYPAKSEDMQLESLSVLRAMGVIVGLSDHTRDNTAAVTATALGARIIEKHFILDRSAGGPDAFFSLEPAEFAAMVQAVRATEAALGTRFGPSEAERASLVFRRSLFASADIAHGELFTADNVRSVRPGHGLAPWRLREVLGRPAAMALRAGTPLCEAHLAPAPLPTLVCGALSAEDNSAVLSWRPLAQEANLADNHAPIARGIGVRSGEALVAAFVLEDAGAAYATLRVAFAPEALTEALTDGRSGALAVLHAICAFASAAGVEVLFADAPDERARRLLARAGFYHFRPNGRCERRIAAYAESKT